MRTALRRALTIVLLLSTTLPLLAFSSTVDAEGPALSTDFKALHDMIPGVVGNAVSDIRYDSVGATQRTTNGLLVWRRENNSTAFTNGYRTWVNGPYGLQQRLNSDRFAWERVDGSSVSPASRPVQPPTRLTIPKISLTATVVAADNDHMPEFPGVGWYTNLGYPGLKGNTVLFGHRWGAYAVFTRLDELIPGDHLLVETVDRTYRYVVTGSRVVTPNEVSVLARSQDYRLTLITCTGSYDRSTQDYDHRLIVTAILSGS